MASGVVTGAVTAPDDARLPGVRITLKNLTTGNTTAVVTGEHGGYRASGIAPGTYDITAELDGFQPQLRAHAAVAAGEVTEVHFRLPLSTVSESVTVVGAVRKESIEASEIRESTARDIGEALGRMNGVATVRKGAIGNDIALDGFQSRDLTVLIDGDRIYGACPNGMDPAVFHADLGEVDHLEVGKGPFDVRHAGSLGGLVNVVTRKPGPGLHLTANLSAGSFGTINPSVTGSLGSPSISVLGGFSYRTANPYRDGSGALFTSYANYRPDSAGSSAYDANTRWARLFVSLRTGHSAQVAYTQQRTSLVLYPYLLMDGVSDNADRLNASYEIVRNEAHLASVAVRAYYSRVDHWMTDALRVSSAGMPREYSMATQAATRTVGATGEVGLGAVRLGVEAFRRQWDATTRMAGSKYVPQYSVPFVAVNSVGLFADYERRFGESTRLEVGGRVDSSRSAADPLRANSDLYFAYKGTRATSAADSGVSGKIRLLHDVGGGVEIETGIGHTERVPDPQERYFALKRMGNDWVGNPGLPPTGNTGLHASVHYRARRIVATVGIQRDRLSDFITVHDQQRINLAPGVMNTVARSYRNVAAAMTSAEMTVTWPLTDRLFASTEGSYTRGTKTPDAANGMTSANIAEIHPPSAAFSLRYDRSVVFAEVQYRLSAKQIHVDTDLHEVPTPGYSLLNLRLGGGTKHVRLMLAVDNLFNAFYTDYMSFQRDPFRIGVRVPEPGRNLYANLAYRF